MRQPPPPRCASRHPRIIPTQTRFVRFHRIFIDDIDHGGRRTSIFGYPSHLRHGMNHHINFAQVLDHSQESILGVGEHVPRKNMGIGHEFAMHRFLSLFKG